MGKDEALKRAQAAANRWQRQYAVLQIAYGYKVTKMRDDFPDEWALIAIAEPEPKTKA